jgi:hypothetical protein
MQSLAFGQHAHSSVGGASCVNLLSTAKRSCKGCLSGVQNWEMNTMQIDLRNKCHPSIPRHANAYSNIHKCRTSCLSGQEGCASHVSAHARPASTGRHMDVPRLHHQDQHSVLNVAGDRFHVLRPHEDI